MTGRKKKCRQGKGSSRKGAILDSSEKQQVQNVMNLSSKPLSDTCLTALSKGLSFVPTTHCRDFDTIVDLDKFFGH